MKEKVKSQPTSFEERFCLFKQENGLWTCGCAHSLLGKKGQFYPDVSLDEGLRDTWWQGDRSCLHVAHSSQSASLFLICHPEDCG